MTRGKRRVKNVSFADNEYENGLFEFSTKPEHGPFSVYVKQLIDWHRSGSLSAPAIARNATQDAVEALSSPLNSVQSPSNTKSAESVTRRRNTSTDDDRDAARSLL